ncbi:protein O21 [Cercopithecine betaherpesvirus 5]|uniref:Protein O21 n=1 Tax=Simian cytomegalovirus (strain Colburn) TaxID=50292 RepID=G8XU40_SCMVC|nr:protein O21 [Cercopithecine betaherpesvirus 5]
METVLWFMDLTNTFIQTALCLVFFTAVLMAVFLYLFKKMYTTMSPGRYRKPLWSRGLRRNLCKEPSRRSACTLAPRRAERKAADAKRTGRDCADDVAEVAERAAVPTKKKPSLCARLFSRKSSKSKQQSKAATTAAAGAKDCRNQRGGDEGRKVLAANGARSSLPPRPPRPPPPRRLAPRPALYLATLSGL